MNPASRWSPATDAELEQYLGAIVPPWHPHYPAFQRLLARIDADRAVVEAALAYRRRERQASYTTRMTEHLGPPLGSLSAARDEFDAVLAAHHGEGGTE